MKRIQLRVKVKKRFVHTFPKYSHTKYAFLSNRKLELISRENLHHLFLTKTITVTIFTKSLKSMCKDLIILCVKLCVKIKYRVFMAMR